MALEMKLNLRLQQQLIMTPQLQQAIKLLQLNHLELVDHIQQEITENPCLEETFEQMENPAELPDAGPEPPPRAMTDVAREDADSFDWSNYFSRSSVSEYRGGFDGEEREQIETVMSKAADLAQHLEWQLHLTDIDTESKSTGMILIGYINDDGYLSAPLEEIIEKEGLDPDNAEWVLEKIQTFDPTGVGARDLAECLLLQLSALGMFEGLVVEMVKHHLHDLERRDYKTIAKAMHCTVDEVVVGMKIISHLEPKPGRQYSGERPQYITPDIYVQKVGDEFIITLNDDGLPKLKVSSYYKNLLQYSDGAGKKEREYVHEKLRNAMWLIRSIHQRQRTIYRVTQSIVKFQHDFLDKGIDYLKPLILRDVAEDISMHESTVSRVTTNKYVHTPQGIFELKFFFNSGINMSLGDQIASESVKNMITKIIEEEDAKRPYSDQKIVELLKVRAGLNIARRTVTKYREMLNILSSTKRKRLY